MAVSLVGSTALAYVSSGSSSVAIPSAAVAGQLAVLVADHGEPGYGRPADTSGWTQYDMLWTRTITAADKTAGSYAVRGRLTGMLVLSGAGGVYRTSQQATVRCPTSGAVVVLAWTDDWDTSSLAPSTGRVGSVVTDPDSSHLHAAFYVASAGDRYVGVTSTASNVNYWAWSFSPTAAPSAPTLVSPAAGAQVSTASPATFAWVADGAQDGYELSQRVGSGSWYYLTSSGTWTTTPTQVASAAQTATTADAMSSASYEWRMRTSVAGTWSALSSSRTFAAVAPPTVTGVTVASPAGDLTPVISWTAAAGAGSLTAWQAAVSASAGAPESALWSSQVTLGTGTTIGVPAQEWTNGATCKAWVRVQQAGSLWSAWVSQTFTVAWTPPAAPSSVVAANQAGGPLIVTVSGIPTGCGVTLQGTVDLNTWTDVVSRDIPGSTLAQAVPLADWGVPVTYRARTYTLVDGIRVYSTWMQSAAVASTDTGQYLVSDDGLDYLPAHLASDPVRKRAQGFMVSYGLSATSARVDRTPPMGEYGTTILATLTGAERRALIAWIDAHDVWWLRWGVEGVGASCESVPATRMTISDPSEWVRFVDTSSSAIRTLPIPWVEQLH